MINNERSNNKMLNLFLVGLGVAFVAGGAYVIYKMQQNSQEKNKSTSSPNEKTRYKDYTIQGTSPESRGEVITLSKNSPSLEDIEDLKKKCWELYKKSFFVEKTMEYYKQAFSGNKILYYTQRILGELFIDKATSTKHIVDSIEKIEDMLNILSYNIETSKTDVPYTKVSFFANRVVNINHENLQNKIAELEANISKTEKAKNYIFYNNLYSTTVGIYKELIELSNSKETTVEQFASKAKKLIDALNKNGIKIVYAADVDETQKYSMFNSNPGASSIPAIVNEINGQVVLKGNSQ